MKKTFIFSLLALSVAACDSGSRECKTELCVQCNESCVVSCVNQAGASEQARCEKMCKCACTQVEDGKSLENAIQQCM